MSDTNTNAFTVMSNPYPYVVIDCLDIPGTINGSKSTGLVRFLNLEGFEFVVFSCPLKDLTEENIRMNLVAICFDKAYANEICAFYNNSNQQTQI